MLCPSGDKIMPEAGPCQAFLCFFSQALSKLKTMTYRIFASKCFKNRRKKMFTVIRGKSRALKCLFEPLLKRASRYLTVEKTMNIARFEPWTFVDLLHRDLDRLAQKRSVASNEHSPVADWVPAVDIIEEKDRFVLRTDVPGVKPEDIDVSMDAGVLSISGERHAIAPAEDAGVQRIERETGRFLRRFTLPETANADGIAAKCADGILEVSIPKAPEVQARRITVEAA
jgi:HSP20 family protein